MRGAALAHVPLLPPADLHTVSGPIPGDLSASSGRAHLSRIWRCVCISSNSACTSASSCSLPPDASCAALRADRTASAFAPYSRTWNASKIRLFKDPMSLPNMAGSASWCTTQACSCT